MVLLDKTRRLDPTLRGYEQVGKWFTRETDLPTVEEVSSLQTLETSGCPDPGVQGPSVSDTEEGRLSPPLSPRTSVNPSRDRALGQGRQPEPGTGRASYRRGGGREEEQGEGRGG